MIVLAVLSMACDSVLDLNPISEIGEESFYKTSEEIDKAVLACYNGLLDPMEIEWAITELHSDNTQMSIDNSMAVYLEYREMDNYTQTTLNVAIDDYWQARYHDIALTNQVLERLEPFESTEQIIQYAGECRFIRAYNYFNLVQLFGPVILVDKSISGDEAKKMERSTVDAVYEFIENDLTIAGQDLPDSYNDSEAGRVTKWAAKALLGKVYLTQGLYSEAATILNEVISSSPYSLLENYADVFDTGNEMNNEILFAVRFMSGNVGLGSPFANYFAPLTSGSNVVNGDGRGWNYPTESIINAFEEGDLRKDVCLKESYLDQNKNLLIERAYINKFMFPVVDRDDAENDWPVIRYADVLLMYGEALNETQGVAQALPYLNEVRNRAGLNAYSQNDIANVYQYRIAMENERRVEFAFENQRYFDLLRTDRIIQVMNAHFKTEAYYNDPSHPEFNVASIKDWQATLPIPQREIDVNPALTQNFGY